MKLQAIKKCCNATGRYALLNCPDGQQWISNGEAGWPVEGIRLTAAAIPAIFDISQKKQEKVVIQEGEITDERWQITPMENEEPLKELGQAMRGGTKLRILESSKGVLMIDIDLEKPAVRADSAPFYFLRTAEGRTPMVVIYSDMLVGGLVMPITGKGCQQVLDMMSVIGNSKARPITPKDMEPDEETGEQLSMENWKRMAETEKER